MMNQRLAIGLMIAQGFLFTAETAIVHHIGAHVSAMQLALLRGFGGLVVVAVIARGSIPRVFRTDQLSLQLLRGLISSAYLLVMMYTYSRLPFADAAAVSYTQVVYIAIFSALLLGEHVTLQRWLAAALGVAGAALVVRPAFDGWNLAYLIALSGAALNGLAFVLNKHLQRLGGFSDLTTMLYINLVSIACSLPGLVLHELPAPGIWPWVVAGVLMFGPLGTYLGIVAVRHAPASTLGPYVLLRLVFAMTGGIVIFRELPDMSSMIGGAVILASCALAAMPGARGAVPRAAS